MKRLSKDRDRDVDWWTTTQAAEWCGISAKAIHAAVAKGNITPERPSGPGKSPALWRPATIINWNTARRLGRLRWPLQPLLERTGVSAAGLAQLIGVAPRSVRAARPGGLTDSRADEWATRAGLHPVVVWGWEWITAALPAEHDPGDTNGMEDCEREAAA